MLDKYDRIQAWVRELVVSRDALKNSLSALRIVRLIYASDGNFLLVRFDDAQAVYDYLVARGIIVRSRNKITLCENCLRITVGTPEEDHVLIETLQSYPL